MEKRGPNRSSLVYRKDFGSGEIAYVERVIETSGRKKPRLVTKTVWVVAEAGVKSSPAQVYTPDRSDPTLHFAGGRINADSTPRGRAQPLTASVRTPDGHASFAAIHTGTPSDRHLIVIGPD